MNFSPDRSTRRTSAPGPPRLARITPEAETIYLASTAMLVKADNGSSDPASKIRGSEKSEIEDWSFGSLAGTQKERDELIKKFAGWGWTPSDFTAKEATKEALLTIHSPYILHLATHESDCDPDRIPSVVERSAERHQNRSFSRTRCTAAG